jgi:hypothetical protein
VCLDQRLDGRPGNVIREATLGAIVASSARRQGLIVPGSVRRRRAPEPLRIGFTYNMKRVDSKSGNDAEAEYDAPETIEAIRWTATLDTATSTRIRARAWPSPSVPAISR